MEMTVKHLRQIQANQITGKQKDRHTGGEKERQADIYVGRQTDKRTKTDTQNLKVDEISTEFSSV